MAYVAMLGSVVYVLIDDLPALVLVWIVLLVAVIAGYYTVTRLHLVRVVAALVTIVMVVLAGVILLRNDTILELVVVLVFAALATALTRYALGTDKKALRDRPPPGVRAPTPRQPVLIMNPKSGGGKVEKWNLVEESRKRGIKPVVLGPGDDLELLARDAVADGADVIGMAGGDGSQAPWSRPSRSNMTFRTCACRPGPGITWRSTSASTATTWWAPSRHLPTGTNGGSMWLAAPGACS
jgi:hypothetical protein